MYNIYSRTEGGNVLLQRTNTFSHLCLYETLLSHMAMLVLGTIHLKVEERESIMRQSMQDREISPSGEISLLSMDTPDRFIYSLMGSFL